MVTKVPLEHVNKSPSQPIFFFFLFFFVTPFDTLSSGAPPGLALLFLEGQAKGLDSSSCDWGFPRGLRALQGENREQTSGDGAKGRPLNHSWILWSKLVCLTVGVGRESCSAGWSVSVLWAVESWPVGSRPGLSVLLPVCSRCIFSWEVGSSAVSHSDQALLIWAHYLRLTACQFSYLLNGHDNAYFMDLWKWNENLYNALSPVYGKLSEPMSHCYYCHVLYSGLSPQLKNWATLHLT